MARFNPRSVEQQMEKFGISKEEAENKVARVIANKKASNPYSVEGQMTRFGISKEEAELKVAELKQKTATGHLIADPLWQMSRFGISKEEAESKIKEAYKRRGGSTSIKKSENPESHFNTIEYWQSKGFSIKESISKKAEHIKKMQSVFQLELKQNPAKYKGRTPLELEYWTNRGYSKEEAKLLRKERQQTFTLDKCVAKYGECIGFDIWRSRNIKWSAKMEEKYKNGEYTRFCKHNYSNAELSFIKNLLENFTPTKSIHCALPGNKQFFRHFKDEGITHSYDFVYGKKIIEFNGDYWHCNPFMYKPDYFHKFMRCTAQHKWDLDKKKIKLIEKAGYEVLVIWESDYHKDQETIINQCIKYLNN